MNKLKRKFTLWGFGERLSKNGLYDDMVTYDYYVLLNNNKYLRVSSENLTNCIEKYNDDIRYIFQDKDRIVVDKEFIIENEVGDKQ